MVCISFVGIIKTMIMNYRGAVRLSKHVYGHLRVINIVKKLHANIVNAASNHDLTYTSIL